MFSFLQCAAGTAEASQSLDVPEDSSSAEPVSEELDIEEQQQQTTFDISELGRTIQVASEGALAQKTVATYRSLFKAFEKYIVELGNPELEEAIVNPNEYTPQLIANWIYQRCEKAIAADPSTKQNEGLSFSQALKMRSAMSYHYAQDERRGSEKWHQDRDGRWLGNPSLSHTVSRYMISLQRRKIRNGEVSQSVRSISSALLFKLHHYNKAFEVKPLARQRHLDNFERPWEWGGARLRMMLQCIYTISFLCLLRFDEVLRIELKDIEVIDKIKGQIKLNLPFRKTHQFGEIKPFHLYFNRKELHLDPVHHLLRWIHVSRLTTGPLFRQVDPYDRVTMTGNKALTTEQFMEHFRNNLLDLGEDPTPYGTHSFRRGGCQYFASERRWDIRKLCEWGGWSMDFDNLTIVRYLMSWNDRPTRKREDYMDPEKQTGIECAYCGRTCDCA